MARSLLLFGGGHAYGAAASIGVVFILLAAGFQDHSITRRDHHNAHDTGCLNTQASIRPIDFFSTDQFDRIGIDLQTLDEIGPCIQRCHRRILPSVCFRASNQAASGQGAGWLCRQHTRRLSRKNTRWLRG